RHPISENDPLAVADLTAPFKADPRKEPLVRSGMRDEIVEAVNQAETITESNVTRRHPCKRVTSRNPICHRPGAEPNVHGLRNPRVHLVGHNVREKRQLKSPPLDVLVTSGGIVELVRQTQTCALPQRFKRDCYPRTPRGFCVVVEKAVAEDDSFRRLDL